MYNQKYLLIEVVIYVMWNLFGRMLRMKKVLMILLCVMCVLVVGCQKNDNEVTNGNVSGELENKDSGENLIIDNSDTEELDLQEKYKLSDDDTLKYEMKKDTVYNVKYNSEDESFKKEQKVIIDGKEHIVSIDTEDFIKIDNKKITSAIDDTGFEKRMVSNVGVIYIDEKPYIVLGWWEGEIAGDNLYLITNNLELKFEKSFEELYKVGDRYIAPEFFEEHDYDHYSEGVVIGYWYYEDGEWKKINRSINGKVLIDDEGNLSDEANIIGQASIGPAMYYSLFSVEKNDTGFVLATRAKYKFKKVYQDLYRTFDIEMLEDSTWGTRKEDAEIQYDDNNEIIIPVENEKVVPKGTIIKMVQVY